MGEARRGGLWDLLKELSKCWASDRPPSRPGLRELALETLCSAGLPLLGPSALCLQRLLFGLQGARGFPGTPGLPGVKGHRVSITDAGVGRKELPWGEKNHLGGMNLLPEV